MNFVQESDIVLSVLLGQNEQWHVTVQDCPQPLASFDDPQSACEWAIQRAKPKRGRVLVEKIPVVWDDTHDSRFSFERGKNARDPGLQKRWSNVK